MKQISRRRVDAPPGLPARCRTESFATISTFDNKTATAVEDQVERCDEDKPKPKKERPAAFSWGNSIVLPFTN
jgi:hypothetical protein